MSVHKPVAGAGIAASTAGMLDKAGIPNLLFGWLASTFVGSIRNIPHPEFVVPDSSVERAIEVLEEGGFPHCTDDSCIELVQQRTRHPKYHPLLLETHMVGAAHFHLHLEQKDILVTLYAKSSVLWWLPNLTLSPPSPDDPHLMLSTDASRLPPRLTWETNIRCKANGPTGPWTELYPIQILNPNSFTEAYLRLFARDTHIEALEGQMSTWDFILLTIKDRQRDDDPRYKRTLSPRFQWAWDGLRFRNRSHEFENYAHKLYILRAELIENGELPADLPVIDLEETSGRRSVPYH